MSVTLLWRTDVHLSDQTPKSRTDVWADTVIEKLAYVGRLAGEIGADAVLDGGDFFDIKSPSRNSHSLVRRAIQTHADYPCEVYANVGNHDCVYGDYNYLHQQPLGVLYECKVFNRLYNEHEAIFVKDGVKVRVVGIPYQGTTYDMGWFSNIQRGDEDYLIVVAHLLASKTVTTMFESEDVVKYEYLDAFPVDAYFFGHWHKDQGIHKTRGGKYIVNIGSLTRGSLSEDDLERVPSVAILRCDREGLTIEQVPVEHAPATTVFDVVAKQMADVREEMMTEFAELVRKELLVPVAKASLRDKIRALPSISDAIREKTLLYVEKAEGGK